MLTTLNTMTNLKKYMRLVNLFLLENLYNFIYPHNHHHPGWPSAFSAMYLFVQLDELILVIFFQRDFHIDIQEKLIPDILFCFSSKEIIPGRPMPPECHAELHTDYDGTAVRWGLTHHVESAADCCQACLDQAKRAKRGEKKCNIWVYCPSEFGCYSPDIYEHKHQECWLKQVLLLLATLSFFLISHSSFFSEIQNAQSLLFVANSTRQQRTSKESFHLANERVSIPNMLVEACILQF